MLWQEFEELVSNVFELHGFEVKRRVVFKDEKGKNEIDVVAERSGLILAIDAKRYTEGWYRLSAIKREAKKHAERCSRYSKVVEKEVIPIVVPLIDDGIIEYCGSLIVPFRAINDFLCNIELYLVEFGFI